MGTISDKLMRIINTKEDIRQALILKGYDVPTSIPFKEYAKMISDLPCKVDDFPKLPGDVTRWHFGGLTNEMMAAMDDPRIEDADHKGRFLSFKNFAWKEGSGISDVYPGALVFDGVDDYGVCENFPILTKEKGYTVVALRKWLTPENKTDNEVLVANLKKPKLEAEAWGAFGCEIKYNNTNPKIARTLSFGSMPVINVNENNVLLCQTSNNYNGVDIASGNDTGGPYLLICSGGRILFANAAIWELIILDHDATEEELTKIKDYFVKTYPWLFPDQAWTVTGKTNEDEDRATIANITGNGNDLVLSNFGFAEGSGYGLYVENYSNSRWFINNSITGTKKSDTFNVTSINQVAVQIQYIAEPSQSPYTVPSYTIKVTGLTDGQTVNYRVSGGISYPITQDGIYILPGFDFAGMGSWYGFQFNKVQETCDITIEQIPEYEGYLVTDGVDDKVQSSSFTMNEDWTIVGDWELLSNVQINCGIVKAQNVYLYNTANGLLISINNPRSLQSFGTKSLHAICSDGRLYDLNWVEYEYTVDQNFEIVESSLNIGFNLNNYTQIAFKNLGIYNNQILSKDDCIKAYNYLQTLKSK